MYSRPIAIAVLLLLPTIADAQSRVRGERRENWDEIDREVEKVPTVKQSDLEQFSAVKLIMDKRKDLKISDDQLKLIKDLGQKEEATNESLYKQVDSLRMAMRKRAGEDTLLERARTTLARQELMTVVRQIRSNYDSTFSSCLPLLDESQRKAATELVEKEREDAEEDLRKKLGGRGRPASIRQNVRRPSRP